MSPQSAFFPPQPRSRFQVGQRVRIVGSSPARYGVVCQVIPHPTSPHKPVRYRLEHSPLYWLYGDILEAPEV